MGPRAFAHGDEATAPTAHAHPACFNGAAGFRPRRHARFSGLLPNENRFNGAAGFRPRRLADPNPGLNGMIRFNGAAGFRPRRPNAGTDTNRHNNALQWGRGLSPTETRVQMLM